MHWSITISFGGSQDILKICGLTKISCAPVKLFRNLTPNCKPIATKSRNYSAEDTEFIRKEILQVLEDDIIEPSYSPWYAQIVVTSTPNKKKQLVVDFSHTINRFTLLDAYHLPQIEDLVNQIAQCCILTFDPAKLAIPRWCTGRKWHILMAVMRGNRVGGNWLTKWDKLKFPWYTHRLMHRKRVTCELHDSYFRLMMIKHAIPKIE